MDEDVRQLRRALEASPKDDQVARRLIAALLRAGDVAGAREAYRISLACPREWPDLALTDREEVRGCDVCRREVRAVFWPNGARAALRRGECVAAPSSQLPRVVEALLDDPAFVAERAGGTSCLVAGGALPDPVPMEAVGLAPLCGTTAFVGEVWRPLNLFLSRPDVVFPVGIEGGTVTFAAPPLPAATLDDLQLLVDRRVRTVLVDRDDVDRLRRNHEPAVDDRLLEREAIVAAFRARDHQTAIDQATRLIANEPRSPGLHFMRGVAFAAAAEHAAAIADLDRSHELLPTGAALLARGRSRLDLGDHAGAIGDIEAALQARPGDLDIAAELGRTLILAGDRARGRAELERVRHHADTPLWLAGLFGDLRDVYVGSRVGQYYAGMCTVDALLTDERVHGALIHVGAFQLCHVALKAERDGDVDRARAFYARCVETRETTTTEHRWARARLRQL